MPRGPNMRAAGIAALARGGARAGEQGLGFFVTHGQVEAKAAELGSSFDSLNRDVEAYSPPAEQTEEWKRWRSAWQDFRAAWEALRYKIANDWFVRGAGGTADLILQFQDRLSSWQRQFSKWQGATLSGPPVEAVEAVRGTPQQKRSRLADIGTGIAIGVGSGVALYALRKWFL